MAKKKNVPRAPGQVREDETLYSAFPRITFDPKVMNGQACIRGIRIPVSLIVNLLANGMSAKEIGREYPELTPEDVEQSLHYAAWLAREEIHT